MSKISRKEMEKMTRQMGISADRGNTWTGYRPSVFKSAKHDKKARRVEGKRLCAEY